MPEVVFILKADTKPGEAHVRQFAVRAEDALRKAFSIEPGNIDLAKALGLNQAINELSTLQKQLQNVQKSLSSLNSLQLKQFRQATIQTIAGVEFDPNVGPSGSFVDKKNGGGVLGRPEAISRLQQAGNSLEVTEINKAISRTQFQEAVRPKSTAGRNFIGNQEEQNSLDLLNQQLTAVRERARAEQTVANIKKGQQALARKELDEQLAAIRVRANAERTAANVVRGQQALARKQARDDREADLTRRRGGRTFTNEDIIGFERAHRATFLADKAKEFRTSGAGRPSSIAKLFGARDQSFQEFLGHERNRGKRIGPEQALGISPTATRLLALSSVLAPLNSQLGAVAMQAGFAAFSLGAPVAALSLLASAVAGFMAVLKKGVATAKEAGLETERYSRATIGLASEMRAFLNVIGVKTQVAFAPVVDQITELFKEIEKLPWDDVISAAGSAGKSLAEMAKYIAMISNATGIPGLIESFDTFQDRAGLQGKQKVDVGGIVGGFAVGPNFGFEKLFGEIAGVFGSPGGREEFVKEPKFDFAEVESVGRNMQKAILASESQDSQTRALQAIDRTSREQLSELRKLNNPTREVAKGVVEGVLGF